MFRGETTAHRRSPQTIKRRNPPSYLFLANFLGALEGSVEEIDDLRVTQVSVAQEAQDLQHITRAERREVMRDQRLHKYAPYMSGCVVCGCPDTQRRAYVRVRLNLLGKNHRFSAYHSSSTRASQSQIHNNFGRESLRR